MRTWALGPTLCAYLLHIYLVDTHPYTDTSSQCVFTVISFSFFDKEKKKVKNKVLTLGARNCVALFTTTFGREPDKKRDKPQFLTPHQCLSINEQMD